MSELVSIVEEYSIVPGKALTPHQIELIELALKGGKLKVDHFKQIVELTKSYNAVGLQLVTSVAGAIESIARLKQSSIDTGRAAIESLERIAISTDDVAIKIKNSEYIKDIADKNEKADDRNHRLVMWAGSAVLSIVLTIILRRPVRLPGSV